MRRCLLLALLATVAGCSDAVPTALRAPTRDTRVSHATAPGDDFISPTTGGHGSCVVRGRDGQIFCWGAVAGVSQASSVAAAVDQQGKTFTSITLGPATLCGIEPAGILDCAGGSRASGHGWTDTVSGLHPIYGYDLQPSPRRFSSVAAGLYYGVCAVEASTGDPYCWGGTPSHGSIPSRAMAGTPFASFRDYCGLGRDGKAYCLVANDASFTTSTPQRLSSLTFVQVDRLCGITIDHAAYCWSVPIFSAPGTAPTPVRVPGSQLWASISVGDSYGTPYGDREPSYVCGVTTDGHGYCWGLNYVGQLGNGNTTEQPTPTLVLYSLRWKSIAAYAGSYREYGTDHTCGVTVDDQVYCWGSNVNGSLGQGDAGNSIVNSAKPLQVQGF
jgi:hypothetical protein